jgi:hypothetical protein
MIAIVSTHEKKTMTQLFDSGYARLGCLKLIKPPFCERHRRDYETECHSLFLVKSGILERRVSVHYKSRKR